jgi:hypothetical protein
VECGRGGVEWKEKCIMEAKGSRQKKEICSMIVLVGGESCID